MARWALNLLFYFSCICMELCLWNHILLKWVIPERNICSEINRKIEQRNSMLCPLVQPLWWHRVQEVWRDVWGTLSPITHGHSWLSFPVGLLRRVMKVGRKACACCSNTVWEMNFESIKNSGDEIRFYSISLTDGIKTFLPSASELTLALSAPKKQGFLGQKSVLLWCRGWNSLFSRAPCITAQAHSHPTPTCRRWFLMGNRQSQQGFVHDHPSMDHADFLQKILFFFFFFACGCRFPNANYWKDYPFPIVYSWLPCHKLINHICLNFVLGFPIEKLLELISKFSKLAGYKINRQKYIVVLFTNNELPEREIKETIPFITASERIN